MYIPQFFTLKELVPRDIYEKYGDRLWAYFDPNLLRAQDFLRKKFGPCTVNNWSYPHKGETFSYRGYRPPSYTKCGTLSTHRLFKAIDSHFKYVTPEEVRQFIIETDGLGWIVKRIEADVNWVHIDTLSTGSKKLVIFKP
jgi:hypothetical protein